MTATGCGSCGRGRPIELQMTTKAGRVLTMRSCPRCESRSWLADGAPVSSDDILRLTADDPDFALVPYATKQKRDSGRRQ